MTESYSQSVEVEVSSKTKAMQWIGIAAILFSLGFLMITIFYRWYFVFPFIAILVVGCVYLHFYNTSAKEYTYEFSPKCLVVAKKDLLNKQRRMLVLIFSDVTEFCIMEGLADDNDVTACGATHEQGVYQLVYRDGENMRRLLFAPDDYMTALIAETIKDKSKVAIKNTAI
ncbi:MAG: hypothetical protein K2M36_02910 [Clostridia bacterium]|nr:hypothetical protein [Clostridia bacterium]